MLVPERMQGRSFELTGLLSRRIRGKPLEHVDLAQYVIVFPKLFSWRIECNGEPQTHSVRVTRVPGRGSLDRLHLVHAQADTFHSQHFLSLAWCVWRRPQKY